MSMPGFGAEQSLRPSTVTYNHAAVWSGGGGRGYVSPQFLDFIVEAIEKVVDSFSKAFTAAAAAIQKAFESGGSAAQGECKSLVGQFLTCPPPTPAVIASQCVLYAKGNTYKFALCSGIATQIHEVAKEYCKNPGQRERLLTETCR